jgi:hypothetical protein
MGQRLTPVCCILGVSFAEWTQHTSSEHLVIALVNLLRFPSISGFWRTTAASTLQINSCRCDGQSAWQEPCNERESASLYTMNHVNKHFFLLRHIEPIFVDGLGRLQKAILLTMALRKSARLSKLLQAVV